ncbi:MAG: hypothetical protein N2112_12215 [Gemmataceae bacterium]|jgi:hypothetical protein|nr:hypothetical protein [Gemmataceae bacterium]
MTPPQSPNETSSFENQTDEVSIQDIHRPVNQEYNEPHDGHEPVPSWAVLIFGVLLFWAGWYIANNSGNFDAKVLDEYSPQAKQSVASLIPSVLTAGSASTNPKKE